MIKLFLWTLIALYVIAEVENKMADGDVELIVDDFGIINNPNITNKSVKRFTWKTKHNMKVQVISYGATITAIELPDKHGNIADITMGFDDMEGYQNKLNPYFGATVGRYANRIGNASFRLNGKFYQLNKNIGNNQIHGGIVGFDKVNWDYHITGNSVVFSYVSADGEEGYPGSVLVQVTYEVFDSTVKVTMTAKTTKPTPINLTNHAYFNLAGHGAGASELYKHEFVLNAFSYTPLNDEYVTTGEIKPLSGLGINSDLQAATVLTDFMPKEGLDSNFCINIDNPEDNFVAWAHHPPSGRTMKLSGNQPGVQFYTSNSLPRSDDPKQLTGKNSAKYLRHGAFCLEPQAYPNALNHPHFPNSILNPGEEYVHKIVFEFGSGSEFWSNK